MCDLVEACLDVTLQHPLVGVGGKNVDLGDGVLRPAPRAEAVGAWLEVRLEDRLEHQLQGGLDHPVTGGGDPEHAGLAACLGDQHLPHGHGVERPGLELGSQPGEQPCRRGDGAWCHSVHPGGPPSLVRPDPLPRNHEEGGINDEVEEVVKLATGIVGRPLVQLGLDSQYPCLRLFEAGPRFVGVHQRPPDMAFPHCKTRCPPLPCGRLSRPRTTTGAPPHPAMSRQRACPSPAWGAEGLGRPDGSHVHHAPVDG